MKTINFSHILLSELWHFVEMFIASDDCQEVHQIVISHDIKWEYLATIIYE